MTTGEAWQQLRQVIDRLVDEHVPENEFKLRKIDWMTTDVLRELRKKRRLWKKTKNGGRKEEYEAAAQKVKNLIRSAKRNMEKKLASQKSSNKKPFYNYVKKKTRTRAGIGPITKENGEMARRNLPQATPAVRRPTCPGAGHDIQKVSERGPGTNGVENSNSDTNLQEGI